MKYRIHYMTPEAFRDGILFATGTKPVTLGSSHVFLREIEASDLEDVFVQMQGEVWSPNGEARDLIRSKGLEHTSMAVGDVVENESGFLHVCAIFGFVELAGRTHS
jgi:hypothetical protein